MSCCPIYNVVVLECSPLIQSSFHGLRSGMATLAQWRSGQARIWLFGTSDIVLKVNTGA